MAKVVAKSDEYMQVMRHNVGEAVVNTGAVVQVPTNVNSMEPVLMEIYRVICRPTGLHTWRTMLEVDGDTAMFGLTHMYRGGASPDLSTGPLSEGVICGKTLTVSEVAPGVAIVLEQVEQEFDFSDEPMIAHPSSLYMFCKGVAASAVINVTFEIWYKTVRINDAQWKELFEAILFRDKLI